MIETPQIVHSQEQPVARIHITIAREREAS